MNLSDGILIKDNHIVAAHHSGLELADIVRKAKQNSPQSFRIEVEVSNRDRMLRTGVTAEIRVPVESVEAHFISPALLTLNDEGVLGVRTVSAEARVEFKPVTVFATRPDGFWITGLPASATIITVGQEFVRHGEPVMAVPDAGGEAS